MPRLSLTEKYAIQGMLHDAKSVEDIAKTLNKTVATIKKYVNQELDKLHNTITKVQLEKDQQIQTLKKTVKTLTKEKNQLTSLDKIKSGASTVLEQQGMTSETIGKLFQRAIKKFGKPQDSQTLVNWCLQVRNTGDLMIHKTGSKQDNIVAVMTPAASARSDSERQTATTNISRTARKNLFSIKDNKIIG